MRLAILVAAALVFCAPTAFAQEEECERTVDLIAGQHIDVGSVTLTREGDILTVKYLTTDPWKICETHAHVAGSLEDIPQTGSGNPKVGHFDCSESFSPGVNMATCEFDLEELGLDDAEMLFIAAHAVVKTSDQEETAWGEDCPFPGRNWALYIKFECDDQPETRIVTSYVGYEDRAGGDFDYNDWGMSVEIIETYDDMDCLASIEMNFEAVTHLAGDSHDIHIARPLSNSTVYNYTISRNRAAAGTETPNGATNGASGDFDVIVFDSNNFAAGDTCSILITVTTCDDQLGTPVAPRFDLAALWGLYDPWMFDRTTMDERHIPDVQTFLAQYMGADFDAPYILVVPVDPWTHPGEDVTITGPYPDFDDFYATESAAFDDWFN